MSVLVFPPSLPFGIHVIGKSSMQLPNKKHLLIAILSSRLFRAHQFQIFCYFNEQSLIDRFMAINSWKRCIVPHWTLHVIPFDSDSSLRRARACERLITLSPWLKAFKAGSCFLWYATKISQTIRYNVVCCSPLYDYNVISMKILYDVITRNRRGRKKMNKQQFGIKMTCHDVEMSMKISKMYTQTHTHTRANTECAVIWNWTISKVGLFRALFWIIIPIFHAIKLSSMYGICCVDRYNFTVDYRNVLFV